ncbi:hypothetical protein QFZ43_001166 [Streptomyces afghaniensis]|nr:hypothetical protein [Streptomyces afghaniensis]
MTRRVSWAGGEEQRDVVRGCFAQWRDLGIGIVFTEVDDRSEAELRIGERGTALHEIGHALGMLHEHQSPLVGIHWDDEAGAGRGTAVPRRPGRRGDRAQRHDRRPAREGPPLHRPGTPVLRVGRRRDGGDVLVTAHARRTDT